MMHFNTRYRISQHPDEFERFVDLALSMGVTSYLEIGARHGGSFYEIVSRLPAGATAVAVDLPNGNWGKMESEKSLLSCIAELREKGYAAHFIFGDSRAETTIQRVSRHAPYGLAFIDGCHLYDDVKADWHNYGPMARMVAFHDIAGEHVKEKRPGVAIQVPRLWKELKELCPHEEIIADGSQMGIGVVFT